MNNKLTLAAALLTVLTGLACPYAMAAQGGFTGPGLEPVPVEQAMKLPDDANVTLRGYIIRHLGGENYLFCDESGQITVEIEAESWLGQEVSPKDRVEISGEVDKDFNSLKIDVDRLVKL